MTHRAVLALIVASGCLADAPDQVASRSEAVQGVTWMNVVGAEAVDDDLTKTATQTSWNAGAASVESIAGDGYAEFTTGENTTTKAVGLSSGDGGQGPADIDFAFRLKEGGNFDVIEGGVKLTSNTGYAPGDLFRVEVLDGEVTYWHNGALLYTSAAAPTFPLLVDTALRTPGATIQNVRIESLAFWTNVVGADSVANDLSKTAPETAWNAGASSLAALDGDGYVEFTTGERTTDKVAGLNPVDKNQGFRDIDFGIFLRANGRIAIREKGVDPVDSGFGPYQAGDIFRVEVSGGVVTYARNGVVFYTSLLAPTSPLHLDTSLRTPGATILDARVAPAGSCGQVSEVITQPDASNTSVAIAADGDRLVVAYPPFNPFASSLGPAWVYRRLASGWIREQVLVDGVPARSSQPGGVAIDGETIAIGNHKDGPDGDGSIRVFDHDGSQWIETDYFDGCPQLYNDETFGISVAMHGGLMAVGNNHDRVYVYRRTQTGWRWEAWLEPESDEWVLFFARHVAVGGDRIFVSWDVANGGTGGIYVYRYDATLPDPPPPFCGTPRPGKWVLETILASPNPQVADNFPRSLDVNASGTLLLAGNPQRGVEDPDTEQPIPNGPGEAYVFELTPGGWAATATLTGSAAEPDAQLGYSVAWGGPDADAPSFAVIGAPFQGPGPENFGSAPGGAYLFWNDGGAWTEVSQLLWPGPLTSQNYGGAVTANAESAFVYQTGGPSPGDSEANITIHDVGTCEP